MSRPGYRATLLFAKATIAIIERVEQCQMLVSGLIPIASTFEDWAFCALKASISEGSPAARLVLQCMKSRNLLVRVSLIHRKEPNFH